jgi:UDP:flavonoid glycosyltransferase YjiC (YdhE family)
MIDQKGVGAALERIGAGVLLPKHARPKRIRAAIETVLHDHAYREAADRVGARIRDRDGADVAADTIKDFVRSQQLVES